MYKPMSKTFTLEIAPHRANVHTIEEAIRIALEQYAGMDTNVTVTPSMERSGGHTLEISISQTAGTRQA